MRVCVHYTHMVNSSFSANANLFWLIIVSFRFAFVCWWLTVSLKIIHAIVQFGLASQNHIINHTVFYNFQATNPHKKMWFQPVTTIRSRFYHTNQIMTCFSYINKSRCPKYVPINFDATIKNMLGILHAFTTFSTTSNMMIDHSTPHPFIQRNNVQQKVLKPSRAIVQWARKWAHTFWNGICTKNVYCICSWNAASSPSLRHRFVINK